jgi:hypothetical protein
MTPKETISFLVSELEKAEVCKTVLTARLKAAQEDRLEDLVADLYARIDTDQDCDWVDDMVHECKGSEASAINNSGFEGQVEYLLESGCTPDQILGKPPGPAVLSADDQAADDRIAAVADIAAAASKKDATSA